MLPRFTEAVVVAAECVLGSGVESAAETLDVAPRFCVKLSALLLLLFFLLHRKPRITIVL